ncbi:MAG TPA: PIN domain-containing protein [Candidatus Saccharimonadales bacterium]|nr:PIN domain-containing protein [Candidatus Saccharimonadales bacterium]
MASLQPAFFDTNIVVYQFDRTSPVKEKKSQELFEQYIAEDKAFISSQVVQEFMNVALRKFDTQIPARELKLTIEELLSPICQHFPTIDYYYRALALFLRESISFYDALIIQAAIDLGCSILYSEDLQTGRVYGSVRVKNPF